MGTSAAHRGTILVIDDDPTILDLTGMILRDEGYRVIAARTHDEALVVLSSFRCALILSDTGGASDGGEAGRQVEPERIRAAAGTTPVVIFSAHDPQIFEQYATRGFAGVIAKPFDLGKLLATVKAMLPVL